MAGILTEDQRAFQETARRFARERIAPGCMAREGEGRIDRALVREMGELGLIGADLPERYGGLGEPSVTAGLAIEAVVVRRHERRLRAAARLAQRADHRPARLAGAGRRAGSRASSRARRCSASRLTEPRGGSDAANLALSARRDGDAYVLNGEKSSISMADQADAAVVFARTGAAGERRARGLRLPGADGHAGRRHHPVQRPRQPRDRPRLDLLRRRARPGGEPAGRGGHGLRAGDAGLRLQPRADRAAVLRRGAGLARRELGLCAGAQGFRRAARPVPGRHLPARRGRGSGRRGAAALLPHAAPARRGRAAHRRGRHVQVARAEDGGGRRSTSAC